MEAEELSNSVLLEISKSSVVRWQEKLKTKYGWFKTENCKNIIFEVSKRSGQSVPRDKSFLTPFTCQLFPAYDAQNVKIVQHLLTTFFPAAAS